jgi:hypothetical protein
MEEMKSGNCGPGCDCGKPAGNRKVKAAVCLIVLLGIGGIFVYKAHSAKQDTAANPEMTFSTASANQVSGQEAAPPTVDKEESAVKSTEKTAGVGKELDSLASLSEVAANQDAVFVFIPAAGPYAFDEKMTDAIASAQRRIEATGARIGLYTLQSGSPDYANIAAQVQVPGMLVMSKGRGMGAVSGEITETKILQAYVASSRVSTCGPSGCGPAACN